jgi:predicted metal-dependent RNase
MQLFEEFKNYENLWEGASTTPLIWTTYDNRQVDLNNKVAVNREINNYIKARQKQLESKYSGPEVAAYIEKERLLIVRKIEQLKAALKESPVSKPSSYEVELFKKQHNEILEILSQRTGLDDVTLKNIATQLDEYAQKNTRVSNKTESIMNSLNSLFETHL